MSDWWKNELYSQFGEDGILSAFFRSKAFNKYGGAEFLDPGFYIDVGAHHPYMLSNTWYFYQRGWRGINIEPMSGVKDLFDEMRPLDINLELAVSSRRGEATFYTYDKGPTSTLDVSSVDFSRNPMLSKVRTSPLSDILEEYLPLGQKIDFLSVDVEGLDLEVLQSNDWNRYRPELVVVEHHETSIDRVTTSDVYKFIKSKEYSLFGWAQPSLIFKANPTA